MRDDQIIAVVLGAVLFLLGLGYDIAAEYVNPEGTPIEDRDRWWNCRARAARLENWGCSFTFLSVLPLMYWATTK